MLIHPLMTTPNGAIRADARACGLPAIAEGNADIHRTRGGTGHIADGRGVAMAHRPQAAVFGGSYGTGVSTDVTTKRPEGLGGSAG